MPATGQRSPTEYAVLAVLCEGPTHGWAIVRALAEEGEVGRVWTVRRALVYRTLDQLVAAGLAAPAGSQEGGRGPTRRLLRVTPAGRRAVLDWLGQPVAHVRDLRSQLLLKLLLGARAGVDQRAMLTAQGEILDRIERSLEQRRAGAQGSDRLLLGFRLETTRAARRFVASALSELAHPAAGRARR